MLVHLLNLPIFIVIICSAYDTSIKFLKAEFNLKENFYFEIIFDEKKSSKNSAKRSHTLFTLELNFLSYRFL